MPGDTFKNKQKKYGIMVNLINIIKVGSDPHEPREGEEDVLPYRWIQSIMVYVVFTMDM